MHKLIAQLQSRWDVARTSLWFIPTILVAMVSALAFTLLWVDRTYADFIVTQLPWLFTGTPSSSQEILSTIAGSVITVVSIAFSLTIVAMQQASAQYSPRLLRNFTSDRTNQLVLGAYIATFVYSLLILRAIRISDDGGGEGFVPSVSLSAAVLLVLVCVGLLIYFINHIAQSLQATTVINNVHKDLLSQIDELYPEQIGEPINKPTKKLSQNIKLPSHNICAAKGGFITKIDETSLGLIDFEGAQQLRILAKVGDFVSKGEVVATIENIKPPSPRLGGNIQDVIVITSQRSVTQDPLFAIRQLVDTALKGLSPGINDPTTSSYCIRYIGNALGILASRDFPTSSRQVDNQDTVTNFTKPTWDSFVAAGFEQIIDNAKDSVATLEEIISTLTQLADRLPNVNRRHAIDRLCNHIEEAVELDSITNHSRQKLSIKMQVLRATLERITTA